MRLLRTLAAVLLTCTVISPQQCQLPLPPPLPATTRVVVYPFGTPGIFDVTAYGAFNDGVNDATPGIKAAIAAALGSGSLHKTVYFPAGTYSVNDTLVWAEFGTTPTAITATIAGGCITGTTISNGGAGFRTTVGGGTSRGLFVYGGNGSGADLTATGASGITAINVPLSCSGVGYTVAPSVRGVNWRGFLQFQGHNQADTIIKLADNTFASTPCSVSNTAGVAQRNCRAVIYAGSENSADQYGAGSAGQHNDLLDLTIDLGANPEAIGVDWVANGKSVIENVTVKGGGMAGISLSRNWSGHGGGGPGLLTNVTITGTSYGIVADSAAPDTGYTISGLSISGQTVYGILNRNLGLWIEGLSSANSVPAVVNRDYGSVVISGATLIGGDPAERAILNQGATRIGTMWLRKIISAGYAALVRQGIGITNVSGADTVTALNVTEYTADTPTNTFPTSPNVSLGLPVEQTPDEYVDNTFANWSIVCSSGGGNDTANVQAALDAGKAIVFLPSSAPYLINAQLHVPAGVRKIMGRSMALIDSFGGGNLAFDALSWDGATGGSLEIREVQTSSKFTPNKGIRQASAQPLILRGVATNGINQVAGGGGTVYMEDVALGGTVTMISGNWFMRQVSAFSATMFSAAGPVNAWMLGMKTGQNSNAVALTATGGARVEVLGVFNKINQVWGGPAYIVTDSQLSLASLITPASYTVVVQENRAGVVHNLSNNALWNGGESTSLFTAY